MLALVLGYHGAQVTEVKSIGEALAAVDREPPDVPVSDISHGYNLIRRLPRTSAHERPERGRLSARRR